MEARLNPSRPIPTAIDAVIEPEDVLLLQYAYSRPFDAFGWLIVNRLQFVYGQSLLSPSLRHAVLAAAAKEIGLPRFSPQYQRHKSQTYRELAAKIKDPALITEADIFASFLFLLEEPSTSGERFEHAKGCLAMMRALVYEIPRGKYVSDFFSACAPLLYEFANTIQNVIQTLSYGPEVQLPKWSLGLEGGVIKCIHALAGFDSLEKCVQWNPNIAALVSVPMINAFVTLLQIAINKVHCYRLDIVEWSPALEGVVQTAFQHAKEPEYLAVFEVSAPWFKYFLPRNTL